MNVVILLNTTWNAYNFRRLIIQNLLRQGNNVTLISPRDEFVHKIQELGVKHVHIDLEASGLNPVNDLKFYSTLKKSIRRENPDIIISYTIKPNIYGSLAASDLKVPIICNVSGLGTTFLWKGWVKIIAGALYQRAFSKSDFVFFQNPEDRKLMIDQLKLNPDKTGLLPGSGINLQEFRVVSPLPLPFTFLMITRLLIDKGVKEFIEASEIVKGKFPDCRIQVVGAYDPSHKRSISEEDYNKLREGKIIEYLGETNDIATAIAKSHCVVLPSYREGTPRTLLEGAAMGKPLIATDVAGCREVVSDMENGFLCESHNVHALAESMIKMIELSDADRNSFGNKSREIAESKFDEEIVWQNYRQQIKALVNR